MMNIRKRNKKWQRIVAILMSVCMLIGLFPNTATATDNTDDTSEGGLVLDKWVEEAGDGFKLVLESYATGSNDTITREPVPVDIVLVLDESGSMDDVLVQGCGDKTKDVNVTPRGHVVNEELLEDSQKDTVLFVGHKVFAEDLNLNETYTVVYPKDGTRRDISYCSECKAWYSDAEHSHHEQLAKWEPFVDESGMPEESREDGWTCTVQFYEECCQTGRDLLQKALSDFLDNLYDASNPNGEEPVNNRVAIVGYGQGASYIDSSGTRHQVYQDPGDGPGGSLEEGNTEYAESAWCDVSSLSESNISEWVEGIRAVGSTPTHLGIQAAELAFKNAPETEDENRTKVMILFTDGAPGANYNNYGPGSSYSDWVTPAIQSAERMKKDNVTIYSVGLFPKANGYGAESISYNVDANGNGSPTDEFFQNANCFLHLVSSNYPKANGVGENERGDLSKDYVEGTKSYYLGTSNAENLGTIFNQISEDVTPGSTTVKLDETAIVKDKITDDFRITYTDGSANVAAYTMSYQGEDEAWSKDEESVSTVADANTTDKLHITVNDQTVEVTNFDFAENFVHTDEDGKPAGKKLVVEILIEPTDATSGGIKLPTNVMNTNHTDNAGIYGLDEDRAVEEFPLPYVDLPTTVTVKKVVESSESTEKFSFEATYVKAGAYKNIPAEESGDANDSNYLQLTDGTNETASFELRDGGTYSLENVKVGSSLTISEDAVDGWTPTVTIGEKSTPLTPNPDGSYTVTVTPGMVITFTNTREATTTDTVTITPADITVYTGGEGYESVMTGEGDVTTEANGLPTPGFLITLPESIDSEYFAGQQNAADLSGQVRFVYDGNDDGDYDDVGTDRVWNLTLYSNAGQSLTSDDIARYVYRMDADSLSGEPIRMLFTDGNEEIVSDDFTISLNGLYRQYDMTIYPGLLNTQDIKAQILVDENNDGEYSEDEVAVDNLAVKVETATLTVRGTTNNEDIHAVGNSTDDVAANDHHITAVAPNDTQYYINNSLVEVDSNNVSLLSDELVETEPLKDYIVKNNIAEENDNYDYRYLDLVDNTNGNAYLTATNPITVYWALPEGADRNDDFRIVHFNALDREYDNLDTMLAGNEPDVYTMNNGLNIVRINGVDYLQFSTDTFSPFVLVWDEADDNPPYIPPSTGDDDDNDEPDTPALNTEDHYLYIEGYPEDYRTGEYSDDESLWPVKPQNNITRAEVATIFYRLLKDEVRDEIETTTNNFTDVNEGDWFNVTVSSLANMDVLQGYGDGTFRPNDPITRAELSAIAVRFFENFEAIYDEGTFTDVTGDEWYADAIAAAEELGILAGYPDGTVRPESNITRAETCAIVNRVLDRRPHEDHLGTVEEMRIWPDNLPGAWYYADMQEATNGHYYDWITIDGTEFEEWKEVDKDYDWTKR